MLGERSDQRGLWEADRLYLDHVGRESFYGLLAPLRGRLFRDADFAEFYCPDNGRDSVPPSLLATALLLQSHDSERASWRRQSCWGSCCSRTWNARGTMAMATMGLASGTG